MANELHTGDYILLGLVMAASAVIGLFHVFFGKRKMDLEGLILADKKMHFIPIALSLVASFQSSGTVLGGPVDTYNNGPIKLFYGVSRTFTALLVAFIYFPIYHSLELTSVYQYLEIRFRKKAMKLIGSVTFILQMLGYLSVVLYRPSLALNAATGLQLWVSVILIGLVCTCYTALGGLKAVIWTDVFQVSIMIVGMLVILIYGSIQEGGMSKVWQIAKEGERTKLFNFDFDPRVKLTTWSVIIGYTFDWLSIFAVNQVIIQRALSATSLRNAKKALLLTAPILMIWSIVVALVGLLLYARYHDCDPKLTGDITAYNQLLPYYIVNVFTTPGFAGLFIAIVFCSTLSTFSSGLNSMSVVTMEDILKNFQFFSESEERTTVWLRLLAAVYGVLIMVISVLFSRFESLRHNAVRSSIFWTARPMLGLITLGMFFKKANWKGGLAGWSVGLIFQLWIGIGNSVVKPERLNPPLPKTTSACLFNVSAPIISNPIIAYDTQEEPRNVFYDLYRISGQWQTLYIIILVILIGVPISYFTGGQELLTLNPKSVLNFRRVFCPCRYKVRPDGDGKKEGEGQDTGDSKHREYETAKSARSVNRSVQRIVKRSTVEEFSMQQLPKLSTVVNERFEQVLFNNENEEMKNRGSIQKSGEDGSSNKSLSDKPEKPEEDSSHAETYQ